MIRRPPRSTQSRSSAASDVYKRQASGIAGAALGLSYLLRAIGDSSSGQRLQWLSWLSPIGWGQQVRPFAGERWWVMTLLFGVAVALAAGAYAPVSYTHLTLPTIYSV